MGSNGHPIQYNTKNLLFRLYLKVIENRILRRRFGPKRLENGERRRLHNEELHSFYLSPNISRVVKFRRLRCAGHVARMEEGTVGVLSKLYRDTYRKETFREALA